MDRPVGVLIADDHTIVREGLAKLLEAEPWIRVVGQARDGREAVQKAEELRPDVVILDIGMPVLNGIEAARRIRKVLPDTRIVILSMHSHDRYISELFGMGVSGYLLKDSSGSDIVNAIQAALRGDKYLSPSISRKVVEQFVLLKRTTPGQDRYSLLSNREREVLQLIAEGRSTREIAEILCVSVSTVKTHRAKIMQKLGISNESQLIRFAISIGLVDPAL